MSRLHDALKRGGVSPPGDEDASTPASPEIFTSPWTVATTAEQSGELIRPVGSLLVASEQQIARSRGFHEAWLDRLVGSSSVDSLLVEQFRHLAATLHQAQLDNNTRIVLVTGAEPGDGKTLTAVNLALVLSESYRRRVLLIDADLRRPSIHRVSQVSNTSGLTDGLKAASAQKLTMIQLTERLTLVPAGRPDPDPMAGLTSPRMRVILSEAAERFDWVVVDSPPMGIIADTSLLASMIDTALLVVRAGRTRSAAVQRAIEALGRERILGVVLNGVNGVDLQNYRQYYTHYGPEASPRG